MTTPPADAATDLHDLVAALRKERDAALSERASLADELAARTAELVARNSEYGERMGHQSATLDVLKAMSASPDDTQPVFDLIVRQALRLCGGMVTGLFTYDGTQVHHPAWYSEDPESIAAHASLAAQFPMPPSRGHANGRAILDARLVHVKDVWTDPHVSSEVMRLKERTVLAAPLMRDGRAIGALAMNKREPGGFSESQVALLQTFAEQAVIAISSAEIYRALQTRTADLQESLEYQTAASDVLKVISQSTFDLQPVLNKVAETAARLCAADQAAIFRQEGGFLRLAADFGFPPEYREEWNERGPAPLDPDRPQVLFRAAAERRTVHIHDAAKVSGYGYATTIGRVRTALGVPLLREEELVGVIVLARQRVESFTDRQIELVATFADQAVIAIENARLINETHEALEQQTATAEVLKVINASPGDLEPVFDAMLDRARRLCEADGGVLWIMDGEFLRTAAQSGFSVAGRAFLDKPFVPGPDTGIARLAAGADLVEAEDIKAGEGYQSGDPLHRVAADVEKFHSLVAVPLRKGNAFVGAFGMLRRSVGRFTENQISLLRSFAAQAIIAMENARLLDELRAQTDALARRNSEFGERIEQQDATIEVLKSMSASPGDAQPVFRLIVERARAFCNADNANLALTDGNMLHLAATTIQDDVADYMAQFPRPVDASSMFGRAILARAAVETPDLQGDLQHFRRNMSVKTGHVRALAAVPLLRAGKPIGAIALARNTPGNFSTTQVELLRTFSEQAVIAITSAETYRALQGRTSELQEALEQQTAMAEVLRIIAESAGDLRPVFDAILSAVLRLSDSAFGGLGTYDGELLHIETTHGIDATASTVKPEPGTMAHRVLIGGEDIAWLPDIRDDAAYRAGVPARVRAADVLGARTQLMVALRKEGKAIGLLNIFRTEVKPFTDTQIALVKAFADQAVIAMENARLLTEQREALEQQTATAEVLQVINSSPGNLAPVFDALLKRALQLCAASFGTLLTFDGEHLERVALLGVPPAFSEWSEKTPLTKDAALISRGIASGKPVQATDIMTDEFMAAAPHVRDALVELGGVHAILQVPLLKDGTVVGFIAVFRNQPGQFPDKQIALLENFAAQAVIAMENARLLTEQREALEQQTAVAEILQVINASPGNLTPVFDVLLERALSLCESAFGTLDIFDGGMFRSVAGRGPAGLDEFIRQPITPSPGMTLYRVLLGEDIVHVADLADDDAYRSGMATRVALVDLGGARTQLVVALRKDNRLIGVIMVYRQEVRPYTDKQIALLQAFAAQAVIAMENARLLTEQREALERQTATAEVLQVINANPGNLIPVFDAVLEKGLRLIDAAFGGLWVYEGDTMRVAATRGMTPALAEFRIQNPVLPIAPLARQAMDSRRSVQLLDIKEGDAYRAGSLGARAVADLGGARTVLVVFLLAEHGAVGAIQVYRQEVRAFTDQQIALLEGFAAQAVIAMDNARLLNEVRQRQEELRVTFENMGDGVALFDEAHNLVAWNRRFQDVLDLPDDLLSQGESFADYIRTLAARGEFGADADAEEEVRRVTGLIGQQRTFERARPNGRTVEVRNNPVADGGFVLIYTDITERKHAEAEIAAARDAAEEAARRIEAAYRDLKAAQANLVQAEKMASLGQLTAGIAHEIKNPLNFVNNFSDLSVDLLAELKDAVALRRQAEIDELSATLEGNLRKIAEHGRRADGIVRSMLEHSRGNTGERRSVELNTLVDEALNLAYHGARAQDQSFNITLQRDFAEGMPPIDLVPQDMTRVLLNLIGNGFYAAAKRAQNGADPGFMPTLKLATRDLGEAVEIRVRDNGTGIPDDIRDKLFQPFFTTKPTGEGTGLGLSISYDIVTQQHGGSITVESKVGEYSEFTIRLPRER